MVQYEPAVHAGPTKVDPLFGQKKPAGHWLGDDRPFKGQYEPDGHDIAESDSSGFNNFLFMNIF